MTNHIKSKDVSNDVLNYIFKDCNFFDVIDNDDNDELFDYLDIVSCQYVDKNLLINFYSYEGLFNNLTDYDLNKLIISLDYLMSESLYSLLFYISIFRRNFSSEMNDHLKELYNIILMEKNTLFYTFLNILNEEIKNINPLEINTSDVFISNNTFDEEEIINKIKEDSFLIKTNNDMDENLFVLIKKDVNIALLITLYESHFLHYKFTNSELNILIKDLDYLMSEKLPYIIYYIVFFKYDDIKNGNINIPEGGVRDLFETIKKSLSELKKNINTRMNQLIKDKTHSILDIYEKY